LEQFGIRSCVLNSELPVQSRIHVVEEFNRGMYNYLIATDEAGDIKGKSKKQSSKGEKGKNGKKSKNDNEYGVSRGIDFQNVKAVINFDFPKTQVAYMHRVGRTARGVGNEGFSLSFINTDKKVNDEEEKIFKEVEEHFEGNNILYSTNTNTNANTNIIKIIIIIIIIIIFFFFFFFFF